MGFSFGSSNQSSTPVDMQAKAFKNLRGPLAGQLMGFFGVPGDQLSGIPQYAPGSNVSQFAAPMAAGEQTALDALSAASYDPTRMALLQKTMSGGFLPGQPGANPFLQAAIEAAQRPTLQGLEQTLGRTLPGRFALSGQQVGQRGSSAFDRAAAMATGQTAQALGDIATNISFPAYQAERGFQQQAIQLSQQEVKTHIDNLSAQALPRMIQDMGIERGREEFNNRIKYLLQTLATAAGVTAPVIANQTQGSTTQFGLQTGMSFAR